MEERESWGIDDGVREDVRGGAWKPRPRRMWPRGGCPDGTQGGCNLRMRGGGCPFALGRRESHRVHHLWLAGTQSPTGSMTIDFMGRD